MVSVLEGEPWRLASTGRLVVRVGHRLRDSVDLHVDTTGAWCYANGEYVKVAGKRAPQSDALLDKEIDVPPSLYNFLLDATSRDACVEVATHKGKRRRLLVPLAPVGKDAFLDPRGRVVDSSGAPPRRTTAAADGVTGDMEDGDDGGATDPATSKKRRLTHSVANARAGVRAGESSSNGARQLGPMTLGQLPVEVGAIRTTIRKLQADHAHKRRPRAAREKEGDGEALDQIKERVETFLRDRCVRDPSVAEGGLRCFLRIDKLHEALAAGANGPVMRKDVKEAVLGIAVARDDFREQFAAELGTVDRRRTKNQRQGLLHWRVVDAEAA